jgi:hypothetical protein
MAPLRLLVESLMGPVWCADMSRSMGKMGSVNLRTTSCNGPGERDTLPSRYATCMARAAMGRLRLDVDVQFVQSSQYDGARRTWDKENA